MFTKAINTRAPDIIKLILSNTHFESTITSEVHIDFDKSITRYEEDGIDLLYYISGLGNIEGVHPLLKSFNEMFGDIRWKLSLSGQLDNLSANEIVNKTFTEYTQSSKQYNYKGLNVLDELPFDGRQICAENMKNTEIQRQEFEHRYEILRTNALQELAEALGLGQKNKAGDGDTGDLAIDENDPEIIELRKTIDRLKTQLADDELSVPVAQKADRKLLGYTKPVYHDYSKDVERSSARIFSTQRRIDYIQEQIDKRKKLLLQAQTHKGAMQKFAGFIDLYKLDVAINPNVLNEDTQYDGSKRPDVNLKYLSTVVGQSNIDITQELSDRFLNSRSLGYFPSRGDILPRLPADTILNILDLCTTLDFEKAKNGITKILSGRAYIISNRHQSIDNVFTNTISVSPVIQPQTKLYFNSQEEAEKYTKGIQEKTVPKQKDISSDLNDKSGSENTIFEKGESDVLAVSNTSKALCQKTTVFDPVTGEYVLYVPDRLSQRKVYPDPNLSIQYGDIVVKLSASKDVPIPEGGDLEFVGFKLVDESDNSDIAINMLHRQEHIWSLELENPSESSHKLELVFRKKVVNSVNNATDWLGTDLADLRARLSKESDLPKHPVFYHSLPKLEKTHPIVKFFEDIIEDTDDLAEFKENLVEIKQDIFDKKTTQTEAVSKLCEYLKSLQIKYEFTGIDYSNMDCLEKLENRITKAMEDSGGAICQDMSAIFSYSCLYLGITNYQDNTIESIRGKYFSDTLHVRNVVIADGKRLLYDPTKFTIAGSGSALIKENIDLALKHREQLEKLSKQYVVTPPTEKELYIGKDEKILTEFESNTFKIERLIPKIISNPQKYSIFTEIAKKHFYSPLAYEEKTPELNDTLLSLVDKIQHNQETDQNEILEKYNEKQIDSTCVPHGQKVIKNVIARVSEQQDIKIYKTFLGFLCGLFYNSKTNTFTESPSPINKIHSIIGNISSDYREKIVDSIKGIIFGSV